MSSVNYFDAIAHNWNVIRSEYFEEKLKYRILEKVEIQDKICADLGCGTGFISLALAEKAELVFSVDLSRNMLREVYDAAIKSGYKNLYPIKGSMEDLPLFDNSIDNVFTNMALHHVVQPEKAIEDMYRILKSGGTAIISDVEQHNGVWAIEEMHDVWLGFSHSQIKNWMLKAGFKNIDVVSTELNCKGYSSKGEFTHTRIFLAKGNK